ncbi:MAG: leucine-rich repeat domain-containing protein, partial [Clostridia bacterium]|nr:leucine-rich repeat domain-containing protein [Clostridia bacterium]
MKKKILGLILVISMVLSFMPVIAIAESSGICGDNLTWTLDDSGTLTISGTGAMTNYNYPPTDISRPSAWDNATSIVIEDGVTSIGENAFEWCSSLASVTIPDSVISIGASAFFGCSSLASIAIPNSVTSIGYYAFGSCGSLESVYVSDIVAWCNIDFASSSSNPLDNMGKLYVNNEVVTNIVIPESIITIKDYVFYGCDSLTSVARPDSVTSIGNNAFCGCDNLTSITIPDSVISVGYRAFYDCSSLTSVVIPDSVTSIGSLTFYNCKRLASVTIPDGITSIGKEAFYGCYDLESVYISNIEAYLNIAYEDCFSCPMY